MKTILSAGYLLIFTIILSPFYISITLWTIINRNNFHISKITYYEIF